MDLLIFLLYAGGAVGVGLAGLLLRRIVTTQAPPPSPVPYECGEKPLGSAYAPFVWPYLRFVVLLLTLEAEVLLALPWVWVYRSLPAPLLWVEITLLAGPLAAIYAFAWKVGWLSITPAPGRQPSSFPSPYRQLNAYLASLGPKPSSYSSHPAW
ncbi:MAG: hypothetical protein D6750_01195, partial [Bacteroidetes bacterium]